VSIDKDLLQVPGMHYNWVRDEKILVTPEVGLRKLYQQVLTGDGTDNIPGIYGIGDVKARKLIAACADELEMLALTGGEWLGYLMSDKKKFMSMQYIPNDKLHRNECSIVYDDWEGNAQEATSIDIRNEVYQLVLVGGEHAKEAAHSCGEEVPIR
jgi:5'-3' exonuclease